MTDPGSDRRPPAFLRSSMRIFDLSLGQMLWSRRSVFLALVASAPVALAAIVRLVASMAPGSVFEINGAPPDRAALFGMMIWLLYVRFIIPVLGVFYGSSLVADEVDDRTITYLFTRPIPRGAVLVGKFLAYLACTLLILLPSVVVAYFLVLPLEDIGRLFPALVKDLGMMAIGLLVYGSVFVLVGTSLKRPLVAGLVFVFGWEPAVLLFPGYLKRLTVAYYLQALVPHAMPRDSGEGILIQLFHEVPAAGTSLLMLGLISAVALWLAILTIERREFVLDR
jgi:ABC-2 type transport system permease protein